MSIEKKLLPLYNYCRIGGEKMNKLKINNSLAAIILVATLFTGWQTTLLVILLMLIFCELDDKIKNLTTTVIAFSVGLTLVSILWSLIYDGTNLLLNSLATIIDIINRYLSVGNKIDITSLTLKFIEPVKSIFEIGNSGVDLLIMLTKFGFVISIFTGAAMKNNAFTRKVNEYINKALGFINNYGVNQAPVNNNNNQNVQNYQNNNF
jgi:hypothetical protein